MPKARIASNEVRFGASHNVSATTERGSRSLTKRIIGGGALVGALGMGLGVASSEVAGVVANADVCYVAGGANDGSGDFAMSQLGPQGRLNNCNEGVQVIPWSGNMFPEGPALQPGIDDLKNRLESAPAWQRKVAYGFSAGSQLVDQAVMEANATNVHAVLIGNPNTRTGIFNSALYNAVPLVKPIAELVGVADNQPAPIPRPGVTFEAVYTKGDLYANAQPQGLDVFALISGAEGMVNRATHRIPAPNDPVVADFYDGDGVRHVVYDDGGLATPNDGSPFTRTGENDPAVRNEPPPLEIPPVLPFVGPIAAGPVEPPRLDKPSFFGEAACVDANGLPYWTPGDAPC